MATTLPDLSSKQLRAVQTVAKYSSFIAASAELRMSQPGLSRVIRTVEEKLGFQLFHRDTRNVTLTFAGAGFLPMIDRILCEFDFAAEALSSLRNETGGHVVVACPLSLANRLIAEIISDYRKQHPKVVIDIKEALRGDVVNQIHSGTADFGLASFMQSNDDFVVEELCETTYHVIFRKDHPFSAQKRVSLAALRDQPMISFPPTSVIRQIFDGAAAREGFRLNHHITVNTPQLIYELVQRGEGISIQSGASLICRTDDFFSARPIDPPGITSRLSTIYLKSRSLTPAALSFKRAIESHFRTMICI
jgi:DNA-binding transcriptional LysR family regulator